MIAKALGDGPSVAMVVVHHVAIGTISRLPVLSILNSLLIITAPVTIRSRSDPVAIPALLALIATMSSYGAREDDFY